MTKFLIWAAGAAGCETDRGPMTLDEAIRHASEHADETPCGQDHEQLALWLMELRTLRESKPGNTAKLREALEQCRDYFYDLLRSELFVAQTVQQTGNPTMDHVKDEQRLYEEITAALTIPPRNCDLFKTAEEALAGHDKSVPLIRTGEPGMKEWRWAFAPATPENRDDK